MIWSHDSYTFTYPLVLEFAFYQTLPSSTHLHQSSTEFRCQTCKLRMGIFSCGAPMGIQWWFKNLYLQIQSGVAHPTTRIVSFLGSGIPTNLAPYKYTCNWVTIFVRSFSTSKKWLVPARLSTRDPKVYQRTGNPARQPRKFWHLMTFVNLPSFDVKTALFWSKTITFLFTMAPPPRTVVCKHLPLIST